MLTVKRGDKATDYFYYEFNENVGAIDLGNSIVDAIINGTRYTMPNAMARCSAKDVKFYDPQGSELWDNMIVEIDSGALERKRVTYFIGNAATRRENVTNVNQKNIKAKTDRTMLMLLTVYAYSAVKDSTENEINVSYKCISAALPTKQAKSDRDEFRKKIIGHHTVVFKFVPNRGDIKVNIRFEDAQIGIEGATAFQALVRDEETLKIQDKSLTEGVHLISDLGGDSLDHVAFKDGKMIDEDLQGEYFGINRFLDEIRKDIENEENFTFKSRYELEQKLIKGQSEWKITHNQSDIDITQYVEPHLTDMAYQFIDYLNQIRRVPVLQEVRKIFAIGGSVKVAQKYIREENDFSESPMKLEYPDNMEILNLLGLWLLVRMYLKASLKLQPVRGFEEWKKLIEVDKKEITVNKEGSAVKAAQMEVAVTNSNEQE